MLQIMEPFCFPQIKMPSSKKVVILPLFRTPSSWRAREMDFEKIQRTCKPESKFHCTKLIISHETKEIRALLLYQLEQSESRFLIVVCSSLAGHQKEATVTKRKWNFFGNR